MRAVVLPPPSWAGYEWPAGCWYFLPTMVPKHPSGTYDGSVSPEFGAQRRMLEGPFPPDQGQPGSVADSLSNKDILVAQLHYDVTHPDHQIEFGVEYLPDYKDTMKILRRIGPGLRGVMVGNQQASEVSYRHMYGAWRGDAGPNCHATAEYIRSVGGMLRDLCITPWFATMDWDILQDAYLGERRILDALNEVGATNYVACGYSCVPGAYIKPGLPERGRHLRWQNKMHGNGWQLPGEGQEFPLLRDYLREGNFWCGLCGPDGIRAGNIDILSAYGYKGFITKILPKEVPKLANQFGEGWWK